MPLCKLVLLSVTIFRTMEKVLSPDAFEWGMHRSDFINAARLLKICSSAIFFRPIKPQNFYKAVLFFTFTRLFLKLSLTLSFSVISTNTFSDRRHWKSSALYSCNDRYQRLQYVHAIVICKFLTIRIDVTRYVKASSHITFQIKTLEKYIVTSVEARVEVYSFRFRKKKNCEQNWLIFQKIDSLLNSKKSWAKSWYRDIFCWDRVIGRNPRNRESPDESGRVDRYGLQIFVGEQEAKLTFVKFRNVSSQNFYYKCGRVSMPYSYRIGH